MDSTKGKTMQLRVDKLRVSIFNDKYELGLRAADLAEQIISDAISNRGEAVIILATGASQFEFLDSLTKRNIDWEKVTAFHLDEYVGLPGDHPASFRKYLRERILEKVGIGKYYLIEGDAQDPLEECKRIEGVYKSYEIDVAFVGIGENGHLAFNDPPAVFEEDVDFKVVNLDEACRNQQLNEGWFKNLDEVPQQAITMTIPAIMKSKAIICSVPDSRKAKAVFHTLTQEVAPKFPASVLRQHPKATLLLDVNSASLFLNTIKT